MAREDLVAYFLENLEKFPAEDLCASLKTEDVAAADIEEALAEAKLKKETPEVTAENAPAQEAPIAEPAPEPSEAAAPEAPKAGLPWAKILIGTAAVGGGFALVLVLGGGRGATPPATIAPAAAPAALPVPAGEPPSLQPGLEALVRKDYALAESLLRPLAEGGNPQACFRYGQMHYEGLGRPVDEAAALHWFKLAAEANYVPALHNLAKMYDEGRGTPKDPLRALALTEQAAELGDAAALEMLGTRHLNGSGVARDEAKALEYYRRAAEGGSPNAHGELGLAYARGSSFPKDPVKAYAHLLLAVQSGLLEAAEPLAGVFVRMDFEQYADAERAAAELRAARRLRDEEGKLVSGPTPKEKAELAGYDQDAQQGNPDALVYLGHAAEEGRFGAADLAKAEYFYRLAWDRKHTAAMVQVGKLHMRGIGVPRDLDKAAKIFKLAAGKGDPEGMLLLAKRLAWKTATAGERAEPCKWFYMAKVSAVLSEDPTVSSNAVAEAKYCDQIFTDASVRSALKDAARSEVEKLPQPTPEYNRRVTP